MFQARYYKATLRTPRLSLRTYLAMMFGAFGLFPLFVNICKTLPQGLAWRK